MKLVDLTKDEKGWRASLFMNDVDHHGAGQTVGEALINLGRHLVAVDRNSGQNPPSRSVVMTDFPKI